MKKLSLFYEEPDFDRWIKFDRYPRKIIRNLIRGKSRPGGVMMIALELMKGLDKLGIRYRFNDYDYAKKNPNELIGIIGKPNVIFENKFRNPILFGAGIFSHPIEYPNLLQEYPNIKKILVPGEWMRDMFRSFYGAKVLSWPVGIDTDKWNPGIKKNKLSIDFLIYEKILWNKEDKYVSILNPIKKILTARGLNYKILNYGSYTHEELLKVLSESKASIFLGEHETQGLAYQQILSTGTPILAWDSGGYWLDPMFFPDKVKYKPVSSVPYWDERCGEKFISIDDFSSALTQFIKKAQSGVYKPREFIKENLTLEICAQKYVDIYNQVAQE
ncbi:hypothetical protein [Pedobacter frigiditerrae]|uniref:glycosyltransferase n=1 Tax=Pedobacter frigiditerrae TaxID=2530452 RepID=UPI002930E6DB|nr:hypothetical protein [Pedobacter frigiditerrae]